PFQSMARPPASRTAFFLPVVSPAIYSSLILTGARLINHGALTHKLSDIGLVSLNICLYIRDAN
ncbi:hypothetical protein, partial [Serratia marcescens]|uniref:hypothetical protein n=1 Tax=Serratia marcescens TaxID=615 RepID=UPI003FA6B16A